jgi:hypothetical protein
MKFFKIFKRIKTKINNVALNKFELGQKIYVHNGYYLCYTVSNYHKSEDNYRDSVWVLTFLDWMGRKDNICVKNYYHFKDARLEGGRIISEEEYIIGCLE